MLSRGEKNVMSDQTSNIPDSVLVPPPTLATNSLIRELTSATREDSETESGGGSEKETPSPGCTAAEIETPKGCGMAVSITLLIGGACDTPESVEPLTLWRSAGSPSPLFDLVPTTEKVAELRREHIA